MKSIKDSYIRKSISIVSAAFLLSLSLHSCRSSFVVSSGNSTATNEAFQQGVTKLDSKEYEAAIQSWELALSQFQEKGDVATCSFPLTRRTLNLRLSLIMRDESIECPKCKNYTFTSIKLGRPVPAKQIGEAGYKTFERQCHYCGYQIQRQPRITLSSVEPAIKSAIDPLCAWERYCDRLKNEIEQMIQCDEVGKDCFKEKYELVDATYFQDDGTPSLPELKYLSTDDRKKAIEFIHKYVQERYAWESDPRNSDAGPE
jgi:DNA-directed RNA polymerase subunit RPC12/RpoP